MPWRPTASPPGSAKKTSNQATTTYLDSAFTKDEVDKNRQSLLDFAARVEMLPIAVAVGASLLSTLSSMPLGDAVASLQVSDLNDGAKNVNQLFAQAIDSQPERERKLLQACAVCVQEGFWLPLAADIAGLSKEDANKAANALVNGSLFRVLDRARRRFQLHALLREQLRSRAGGEGLSNLQERHAAALEELFKDWETRWRDCRECLDEIIPAAASLWANGNTSRQAWVTYWGYATAERIGELDAALRILQQEESFWRGRDDRAAKDALQRSYGNQALILKAWGQLDDALALHKKEEAIALELGDKDGLQATYGNQALILQDWGRLDDALALHKKKEDICLEIGNKASLSKAYSGQGLILKDLGRLDEALALYKKEEALCVELGDKDGLQRSYGNQALILQAWGRLDDALALHKKEEAIALELGDKDGLQATYGNQALILQAWGRLDEALALHKKEEALCLELGNKDSLQRSYGNQAAILRDQGELSDALALYRKKEEICLELGNKSSLANCYWHIGYLAGLQDDHATEKQKLQQALALFTELNMPRERDAAQAELDQLPSANT